jgi:hypothetical protein
LPTIARIMLYCAAALIAIGGLYDVFVPRLPSNLVAMCGGDERACKLVRELLRALGGSLVAVGATVAFRLRESTLWGCIESALPSLYLWLLLCLRCWVCSLHGRDSSTRARFPRFGHAVDSSRRNPLLIQACAVPGSRRSGSYLASD